MSDYLHDFGFGAGRARRAFDAVPGLELIDAHRGVFESAGVAFDVRIEAADRIRLQAPAGARISAEEALRANGGLVGNLRYARVGGELALVADTQLDGAEHLVDTLEGLAAGVKCARDGAASPEPGPSPEPLQVESAVADLGWAEEAIVRHADSWELRPRILGAAAPTRVELEAGGLRVRRVTLRSVPAAGDRARAVAELALQWNARLRLARISLEGPALSVESRLRTELVSPHWIGELARAVASGSSQCRLPLTLLAAQERAAECFLAALAASTTEPEPEPEKVAT